MYKAFPKLKQYLTKCQYSLPNWVQPWDVPWTHPPVGPPAARSTIGAWCNVCQAVVRGVTPGGPIPWYIGLQFWHVTSLLRKEPEVVIQVERYRLFSLTHPKLGFWNQSRETCWTLIQSGIALGKRQREGVGTLVSPGLVVNKRVFYTIRLGNRSWLFAHMHQMIVQSTEFSLDQWVGCLTVLRLVTPSSYCKTSVVTWAMTMRPPGVWRFVIGLLCKPQIVHNEHHVPTKGCPSSTKSLSFGGRWSILQWYHCICRRIFWPLRWREERNFQLTWWWVGCGLSSILHLNV